MVIAVNDGGLRPYQYSHPHSFPLFHHLPPHCSLCWTVTVPFLFSGFSSLFHNLTPFGWAAAIFKGKSLPGSLIEGSKYSFPFFFVGYPHLSSYPMFFLHSVMLSGYSMCLCLIEACNSVTILSIFLLSLLNIWQLFISYICQGQTMQHGITVPQGKNVTCLH